MVEKLIELEPSYRELRKEVNKTLDEIKSKYSVIYRRRKGIKVDYTYEKYDTKYLQFDYDSYLFYVRFSHNQSVGFSLNRYKKT